ncbi:hypothetical protein EZ449_13570 [Pedobacter frigidisoli]|uniref:Uncharacterized protein n=1 Tax=Pedobacter frigidisoli TaxID=2530455 RepID=A0A4R0NYQ6_9SPHI|nr:hypothetical protein [Pedobacter frigidisoli]TCD07569.1 hypothetical protein EZ449_13570 [Pedobacter frigidisoli]
MKLKVLLSALLIFAFASANAQHEMHTKKDSTKNDSLKMDHDMGDMDMEFPMSHSYSLNLPMQRNGSGTAWLPDASPMYGMMIHAKKWMYMLHGNITLRYTNQDLEKKGSRGSDKFDAPNWFMFMGQRKVGEKGLFHFSSMLSLDRFTEGGAGYPLLFQTGESWKGQPLVDRQHPHDLFSELSVAYTYAFSKKTDFTLYLGYPGEPALGSVAFMHRPSALANPDAPISHHWNDGTHITFGVATLGFRYNKFKIEASSFTGREPNENRFDFDKPRFDSFSARLSFNPNKNWALQVSQGWIKSPEELHENEDVNRTIASAIYALPIGDEQNLNATVLWGMNKTKGHESENAALLEAAYRLKKFSFYSRYEWVQKSVEELNLDETIYGHKLFGVNALSLGLNYDVFNLGKFRTAIGGQVSLYKANAMLDNLYGKNPIGAQVFIRIYPALMKM